MTDIELEINKLESELKPTMPTKGINLLFIGIIIGMLFSWGAFELLMKPRIAEDIKVKCNGQSQQLWSIYRDNR